MKKKSIYEMVQDVKHIEQEELINALKLHGDNVDNGFEIHFEHDNPIIAVSGEDNPYDAVIMAVRVDKDDNITLLGDDKECRGYEHDIDVDDVFAGHLEFVTDVIVVSYNKLKNVNVDDEIDRLETITK